MNFRKLLTYLTVSTAAVIPFAGAQNPTILQGSYISNVFGNSNFVLNPNAQTNVANVTTVTATVTRSTTTPLVATSEFNVAITSANGTATWATRAFDAGMKGQNCEARFTYRGFAATSKVHIKQSTNVVASLTLTPATDPRIASINFPCGDLSTATTFVVTDTAILAGTNEIGGIYVGLATNMANVAQAEAVGGYKITARTTRPSTTSATFANLISGVSTQVVFGKATSSDAASGSVTFASLPAGNYMIAYTNHGNSTAFTSCEYQWYEDTSGIVSGYQYLANDTAWAMPTGFFEFTTAASRTFRIQGKRSGVNTCTLDHSVNAQIVVYRFPSSSELVVTPERQNTFASVLVDAGASTAVSAASWTNLNMSGTPTRTYYGKAQAPSTVGDVAIKIPSLPVGTYQVIFSGQAYAVSSASGVETQCLFAFSDGTTRPQASVVSATGDSSLAAQGIIMQTITTVFNNTSVQDKTFTLQAYRNTGAGSCNLYSDSVRKYSITVIPLDQPSNSALYVQGPVKAAETGAAIPAGYVGQKITVAGSNVTPANVTEASFANTGVLPAGIWSCSASVQVLPNAGSYSVAYLGIGTASNDLGPQRQNILPPSPGNYVTQAQVSRFQISSTGSTTVHAVVFFQTITGSPSPSVVGAGSGLECVRVN